jgi:hypothetical protein
MATRWASGKDLALEGDVSTHVVDAIARAAVPGPVVGTRLTEAYARHVARDAYFWAWPMMNIYNRRLAFKQAPEVGLMTR